MDSAGNSGSMQSSSGGDEEYDSTFFFNSGAAAPHHHLLSSAPFVHLQQPQVLSSYFDSFLDSSYPGSPPPQQGQPPQNIHPLHLDVPTSSRLPRTCTTTCGGGGDLAALIASSSSNINSTAPPSSSPGAADQQQQQQQQQQQARPSKKRPRASRRAPTTDTTNFRQMVQEFTGIPAPPFATSSALIPPRSRFDLFSAAAAAASSAIRSETSFLLRPFAHKAPPLPGNFNPFVVPSSSSSPSSTANNNTSTTTTTVVVGPTCTSSSNATTTVNTTTTTSASAAPAAVCDNPSGVSGGGAAIPSPTTNFRLPPPHDLLGLTMQHNGPSPTVLQYLLRIPAAAAGQDYYSSPTTTMPMYGLRPPAAGEFVPDGVASGQLNAGVLRLFATEGEGFPSRSGTSTAGNSGGGWPPGAGGGEQEHQLRTSFVGSNSQDLAAGGCKVSRQADPTSARGAGQGTGD